MKTYILILIATILFATCTIVCAEEDIVIIWNPDTGEATPVVIIK